MEVTSSLASVGLEANSSSSSSASLRIGREAAMADARADVARSRRSTLASPGETRRADGDEADSVDPDMLYLGRDYSEK